MVTDQSLRNFPWYSSYPNGVPPVIGAAEHDNVADLLVDAARKYGAQTAFICMGRRLSYDEVDRLSSRFAGFLQQELAMAAGDRIAIQLPNILAFPVAFIGAVKAGLVVVNANPLLTAREMKHQFRDAKVSAIVVLENIADRVEKILPETDIKHVVLVKIGDLLGSMRGAFVNFFFNTIKGQARRFSIPHAVPFKDALRSRSAPLYTRVKKDAGDLALLQYTGGTTGVPRGAMLSHGNLIAHNQMIGAWFRPLTNDGPPDIMITPIPLYHIFGLTVNFLLMYHSGACNVLIPNPRDIGRMIGVLRRHRFSLITGVNTLFNALVNDPRFARCDFSNLRAAIAGAMAVQEPVAARWRKVTGQPLVQGYGLSETSPVVCCNPLDGTHRDGTIGLPMPSTEVRIVDEHGNDVPVGSTGEIVVRGPQVMSGYRGESETTTFFPGNWFRTGDIGTMDPDGFFAIVDRKKDMIKTSGFNVYPNEIEGILARHEKVFEVAAVGVPDAHSGEAIKVFIVRKDETLTEPEVIRFCRQNLSPYKVPRHVEFRDTLPKSSVGKILRRMLKDTPNI